MTSVCCTRGLKRCTLHAVLVNAIGTPRFRRRGREAVRSLGSAALSWFISGCIVPCFPPLRVFVWLLLGVYRTAGGPAPQASACLRTGPAVLYTLTARRLRSRMRALRPHGHSRVLIARLLFAQLRVGNAGQAARTACYYYGRLDAGLSLRIVTTLRFLSNSPEGVWGFLPHRDHIPVSSPTSLHVLAAP